LWHVDCIHRGIRQVIKNLPQTSCEAGVKDCESREIHAASIGEKQRLGEKG
jgi:hypothetical protein